MTPPTDRTRLAVLAGAALALLLMLSVQPASAGWGGDDLEDLECEDGSSYEPASPLVGESVSFYGDGVPDPEWHGWSIYYYPPGPFGNQYVTSSETRNFTTQLESPGTYVATYGSYNSEAEPEYLECDLRFEVGFGIDLTADEETVTFESSYPSGTYVWYIHELDEMYVDGASVEKTFDQYGTYTVTALYLGGGGNGPPNGGDPMGIDAAPTDDGEAFTTMGVNGGGGWEPFDEEGFETWGEFSAYLSTVFRVPSASRTFTLSADGLDVLGPGGKRDNDRPILEWEYRPERPDIGEAVEFDASGSSDPDGTIETYRWVISGQEVWTDDPILEYRFDRRGYYRVKAQVKDNKGKWSYQSDRRIYVYEYPQRPVARFTHAPEEPDAGETVEFDGSGSEGVGPSPLPGEWGTDRITGIQEYEWDFDGDGEYDATGETASHSYGEDGVYNARLRVTDDVGDTDTADAEIVVGNATIEQGFEIFQNGDDELTGPEPAGEVVGTEDPNETDGTSEDGDGGAMEDGDDDGTDDAESGNGDDGGDGATGQPGFTAIAVLAAAGLLAVVGHRRR